MTKQKVCLVTGAAGTIGQHLLSHLVLNGYKVLALGDTADIFTPDILKNRKIRVTTALPVSAKQFEKYDVQFCFGDMSDISFLASVFASADKGDIEIEFLFHLSAHHLIKRNAPAAYHPDYGDTVNLLEVSHAYWQDHKDMFKGFFYAADTGTRSAKQTEKLMNKMQEKDAFPTLVYHTSPVVNIGSGYTGRTSLSSLYRVLTPFKAPEVPLAWKKEADYELYYIAGLKRATDKVLEQIKSGKIPNLADL